MKSLVVAVVCFALAGFLGCTKSPSYPADYSSLPPGATNVVALGDGWVGFDYRYANRDHHFIGRYVGRTGGTMVELRSWGP